eukprot:8638774-Pyramimonas_sp.AAC.1
MFVLATTSQILIVPRRLRSANQRQDALAGCRHHGPRQVYHLPPLPPFHRRRPTGGPAKITEEMVDKLVCTIEQMTK